MDPVIEKNLARWATEQKAKKDKREHNRNQAIAALTTKLSRPPREHEIREQVKFMLAERRAKWLLKNCRATVGEIVKMHGAKS